MPYQSAKIANYFLELAHEKDQSLTPLKLQKLLYFAHGWHLALESNGRPLLDEDIEAWEYGPVVPSIYHRFKTFRNKPIPSYAFGFPKLLRSEQGEIGPLLSKVWEIYSPHTGMRLSNLTHLPETPWWNIRDKYDGNIPMNEILKREDLRAHFLDKLRRSKA